MDGYLFHPNGQLCLDVVAPPNIRFGCAFNDGGLVCFSSDDRTGLMQFQMGLGGDLWIPGVEPIPDYPPTHPGVPTWPHRGKTVRQHNAFGLLVPYATAGDMRDALVDSFPTDVANENILMVPVVGWPKEGWDVRLLVEVACDDPIDLAVLVAYVAGRVGVPVTTFQAAQETADIRVAV